MSPIVLWITKKSKITRTRRLERTGGHFLLPEVVEILWSRMRFSFKFWIKYPRKARESIKGYQMWKSRWLYRRWRGRCLIDRESRTPQLIRPTLLVQRAWSPWFSNSSCNLESMTSSSRGSGMWRRLRFLLTRLMMIGGTRGNKITMKRAYNTNRLLIGIVKARKTNRFNMSLSLAIRTTILWISGK